MGEGLRFGAWRHAGKVRRGAAGREFHIGNEEVQLCHLFCVFSPALPVYFAPSVSKVRSHTDPIPLFQLFWFGCWFAVHDVGSIEDLRPYTADDGVVTCANDGGAMTVRKGAGIDLWFSGFVGKAAGWTAAIG